MEIGETREGSVLTLRPAGRIDNVTSPVFQQRLLDAVQTGAATVVADFSALEYISSAGLRALMMASRRKPEGCRLAVVALNPVVQEIFAISRFNEVVPVFATAAEAIDAPGAAVATAPLRVHFWGTRGSLPCALNHDGVRAKVRDALIAACGRGLDTPESVDAFIDRELPFAVRGTFGGNSSCVELAGGDEYVICDLGTGVREFGNRVIAEHGAGHKHSFNIFLSHLHWDHIMGLPFFVPAYIPGNTIRLYGCHQMLREMLATQQSQPFFPVDFGSLGATIEFISLEPGRQYSIGGFAVTAIKQFHTDDSYGYRFERSGKTVVYSTDCEHKFTALDDSYPFVGFYRNADVLIFDAMYSLADSVSIREDWGHSSNIVAVELAQKAGVKRLALFHHEPTYDDGMIDAVLGETVRFEELSRDGNRVEVLAAYDGLDLTV
ncbi:MAG TPA: anti-sigma factor antagonist [Acetobacteraceae bacterium]|nr:anti-sigma factor antagonist [Acetobacteraceae bacterium]